MDFIIISDNASSFHCESLYKETGEVQQIFFPKTKIHRMVLEKSYEYNGVVVSMLKSCVVLSDDDSFANRLTTYVDNMPHQRPGEEAVNSPTRSSSRRSCCRRMPRLTRSKPRWKMEC